MHPLSQLHPFTMIHLDSPQFDDVEPHRFEIGQRLPRAYAWRFVEQQTVGERGWAPGFLLLGSGTRKTRARNTLISANTGAQIGRVVEKKGLICQIQLGMNAIFRWLVHFSMHHRKPGSQWFMHIHLAFSCVYTTFWVESLQVREYRSSGNLACTWMQLAVMIAVGSIYTIYIYISNTYILFSIIYILNVYICSHEFNMESRCIEFDTQSLCVTINLYVKNPYDRIYALY